jgi:uncharacterized protein
VALEMRERCERCDVGLAPEGEAVICSHECTFCRPCGEAMAFVCPNCSDELVARPKRVTT